MSTKLDEIIQQLQNLHPWNIQENLDDGTVQDWFAVTGPGIVPDLVIREDTLHEQVQLIASQIMYWGRMLAKTKLIWEIAERKYRVWRDDMALTLTNPEGRPEGWKKPTDKTVERLARTHPEYTAWYETTEKAEEAYNSTQAVLEGFKAKKEVMKMAVVRHKDNSAPTLSV